MGDWIQGVGEITTIFTRNATVKIGVEFQNQLKKTLDEAVNNPSGRRCSYIKDCSGNLLYEGDKIKYDVRRSLWYIETTKDDKKNYRINGTIVFKEYKGGKGTFMVYGDEEEVAALKVCRGKERKERNVMDEKIELEHITNGEWSRNHNLEKIGESVIEEKINEKGFNRLKSVRVMQKLRMDGHNNTLKKVLQSGGKSGQEVRNIRKAPR